jgi:hypothetical protein
MDTSRESRLDIAPKLISAALFLCTAVSIAAFLTIQPDFPRQMLSWRRPDEIAAAASPLVFLCACVLVFFRPRFGYALSLLGGFLALPLFVRIELSLAPWNSWIILNQGGASYFRRVPALAMLRILSPALIVFAVSTSFLRALPARWSIRSPALRQRTRPGLALGFLVLVAWFVHSVTPFSDAAFDHPAHFEFRILHVQKHGLRFHETRISEYRNGQVWIHRHERRLFQYRFEDRVALLTLGEQPGTLERARTLVQSPALWKLHTPPAKALWWWNAEGWYVVLKDSRLLAFTSEYGTAPPQEVTALFHEIEKLPASEERSFDVADVCMGFCYDPVPALGFSVLRQRTRLLNGNNSGAGGVP